MENNQKPPTQSVGVEGFKADVYASDEVKIPWHDLIHIPKFQMFALEMSAGRYGDHGNVMEWIVGFVQDQSRSNGEQTFFHQYSEWHDKKGYWNNETIFGELK